MRKLVEIWDYFMRRKVVLLMILSILALDGIIINRLLTPHGSEQLASDLATVTEVAGELKDNSNREYLIDIIEDYQAKTPTEVLQQAGVDVAAKTKVLLAYQALEPEDQEVYKEFISQVNNGDAPVIRFFGKTNYRLNDEVDVNGLVKIEDEQDGSLIYKLVTVTNLDTSKVGEYYANYTATDSDGNVTRLDVDFTVTNPQPVITEIVVPAPEPKPTTSIVDSTIDAELQLDNPPSGEQAAVAEQPVPAQKDDPSQATSSDDKSNSSLVGLGLNNSNFINDPVTTDGDTNGKKTEFNLGRTIALVLAGAAFLAILVRFIFDHYVR